MSGLLSNLDIMKEADAFPYPDDPAEAAAHASLTSTLYTLLGPPSSGGNQQQQQQPPLGLMLSQTVRELEAVPEEIRGPLEVDEAARTVRAFCVGPDAATEPQRSAAVARVMAYWRARGTFSILSGWRDELWPVYGTDKEVLYNVERSGTGLLGVMRYGVHMVGYVRDDGAEKGEKEEEDHIKIWVPRRALTKSTYPGMLDNTVAGGLMTGEDPFECIVREADEEADLPEALMRERARFVGTVTYIHVTDARAGGEAGQIYPEMQWVYEIEMPPDVTPTPKDGEVAEFRLLSVAETKAELARGKFKPNCALIEMDFFVRHGIITPENDGDYDEIVRRLHRKLPFPGPHQLVSATADL